MAIGLDVNVSAQGVTVRRRPNGRYQLLMKYKDGGTWHQATKMLPESVNTENKARRRIAAWREELAAEQEAARSASEAEARRADEEARGASRGVSEYVRTYIDTQLDGSGSVKRSTLNGYRTAQGRIEGWFGDATMGSLTQESCQEFVNSLNRTLSPRSVRKTAAMLKRACQHAVEHGVIRENPCSGLVLPKLNRVEKNSLTAAQYRTLCSELSGMGQTPVVLGAEVALRTGMREGEVCALRWQDVNMGAREIRVEHNIEADETGTRYGETKRLASNRVIPIGDSLASELSARRAAVWARAMGQGMAAQAFGRLFVLGDIDGAYYQPDRLGREWAQLSNALGLVGLAGRHVTFHDLRHTYATVAIASGADVMAVSSYLGHSDPHVTLREYANADPEAKRRTAEIMDRAGRV